MSNCSKLPNFISQRASLGGRWSWVPVVTKERFTCVFLGPVIIRCAAAAAASGLVLKPARPELYDTWNGLSLFEAFINSQMLKCQFIAGFVPDIVCLCAAGVWGMTLTSPGDGVKVGVTLHCVFLDFLFPNRAQRSCEHTAYVYLFLYLYM